MFDRMVNFVIIISTFCPLLYNTIQVSQMELLHLRDLYCMFEITKGMALVHIRIVFPRLTWSW